MPQLTLLLASCLLILLEALLAPEGREDETGFFYVVRWIHETPSPEATVLSPAASITGWIGLDAAARHGNCAPLMEGGVLSVPVREARAGRSGNAGRDFESGANPTAVRSGGIRSSIARRRRAPRSGVGFLSDLNFPIVRLWGVL